MGADRALTVVALQSLLMTGVRNFGENPAVATHTHRVLATAASLDYILMLVTDSAGARIPADDSRRAVHDGFARAVDDGLNLLRAIVEIESEPARAFVRAGLPTLRAAITVENLGAGDRSFSMIALASDAQQ